MEGKKGCWKVLHQTRERESLSLDRWIQGRNDIVQQTQTMALSLAAACAALADFFVESDSSPSGSQLQGSKIMVVESDSRRR